MDFAGQVVCQCRGRSGTLPGAPVSHQHMHPQPRKAKICLQVMNKKFLLSEKYFSLGRSKKPGPLFAFQGKNPVFTSFALAANKMWVLTNTPQSAVLSPLWCFGVLWVCRSHPSQLRASPLPQPACFLQDLFGEMPVDATLQLVPAGLHWAAHLPLPSRVGLVTNGCQSPANAAGMKIWPCRHCWRQAEGVILILLKWSFFNSSLLPF